MSDPTHAAAPHDFVALYHTQRGRLLARLTRMVGDRDVAEDLCQDSFIKALTHWDSLRDDGNLVGWLFRIGANTAYDELRRRRRQALPLDTVGDLPDQRSSLEGRADDMLAVQAALHALPPDLRGPLILHAYAGQPLTEVAARTGISVAATKSRLRRGRARFRATYQG